jgi:hypothetical protein
MSEIKLDQTIQSEKISKEDEKTVAEAVDKFNIEKLQEINPRLHKNIALGLIEKMYVYEVAANLDYFKGLDQEIAVKIIKSNGESAPDVLDNLDKFSGINIESLVQELIAAERPSHVTKSILKIMPGNLSSKIAEKLIESGRGDEVSENMEFNNLSPAHRQLHDEINSEEFKRGYSSEYHKPGSSCLSDMELLTEDEFEKWLERFDNLETVS